MGEGTLIRQIEPSPLSFLIPAAPIVTAPKDPVSAPTVVIQSRVRLVNDLIGVDARLISAVRQIAADYNITI